MNAPPTDRSFPPTAWTVVLAARDAAAPAMREALESYALRGKGELLAALKPALISTDAVQPYAGIGSAFGVGEAQIKIEVHRLRRRLAERLRMEVAATLDANATAQEVEEETRYLVQALAYQRLISARSAAVHRCSAASAGCVLRASRAVLRAG